MSYTSKFDLIPGYKDAVFAEQEHRDADFLSDNTYIYGIEVRKLTPRLLCILTMMKHPMVTGGDTKLSDCVSFVWVVSTAFTKDEEKRKQFFGELSTRLLDEKGAVENIVSEIGNYLRRTFEDSISKTDIAENIPYVSSYASIVDVFASEYGWKEQEVFNMPFRRIFGYLRAIILRQNPKTKFDNPSDKVVMDFIGSLNK